MKKRIIIIVFILICSFFGAYHYYENNYNLRGYVNNKINKFQGKTLNKNFDTKIKSGNLSTDYDIDVALGDIKKFNLNTINVPVAINISGTTSNDMSLDDASEKKAIKMIKKLKGKKINVILEPYPWINNGSSNETDWNPENKKIFFDNWKFEVLKPLIDDVAIPCHVDAINIGTGFNYMESDEKNMCAIVDYARRYYKGLVTYRTSWWYTAYFDPKYEIMYENKLNNKLFSKLDFISIAAYFELTSDKINNDTNTVNNLVSALQYSQIYDRRQNIKQQIENFNSKWKKPIFFGELGFPKVDLAAFSPWNSDPKPYRLDNTVQANCFEAYRRVFEKQPWLLGFSVFAIGEHSENKHYYPSEDSTNVIRKWYNR